MQYMGTLTGGRWFDPGLFRAGMILFSFGVGEDVSFEQEAMKYGVKVHCFDPTPKSRIFMQGLHDDRIDFHQFGIWEKDMEVNFYYPENNDWVSCSLTHMRSDSYFVGSVYRLDSIIGLLAKKPDMVKLDIEGAEYKVLEQMIAEGLLPEILMVEFHSGLPPELSTALSAKYTERYVYDNDYLYL